MVKLFFTIVASFIFFLTSFIQLSLSETTIGLEAFRINPKSENEITSQSMKFKSKTKHIVMLPKTITLTIVNSIK